jgi:hypothetical protein
VGGILAGAAATLGAVTVANVWNPLGWTAGVAAAVALLGGITSTLLGWLGKKSQKAAEQRRLAARREAIAHARKSISQVYDDFSAKVVACTDGIGRQVMSEVISRPIQDAIALRTAVRQSDHVRSTLATAAESLPQWDEPQFLIYEAARSREARLCPGRSDAATQVWLGETRINDPVGLQQAEGDPSKKRTILYDPGLRERMRSRLRDLILSWTEARLTGRRESLALPNENRAGQ